MSKDKVCIHWYRRDLRTTDNTALYHALDSGVPVLPVFVFDRKILDQLEDKDDKRVNYIHSVITDLKADLEEKGGSMYVYYGAPRGAFQELFDTYDVQAIYTNEDYEPYARERDDDIAGYAENKGVEFHTYKDHVIFAKDEVVKSDGDPYVVFTPYSKVWRQRLSNHPPEIWSSAYNLHKLYQCKPMDMVSLEDMGFRPNEFPYPPERPDEELIRDYAEQRNYPGKEGTSRIGVHLRFGTVSIRKLLERTREWSHTYVNELIWRDFYQQILWHFPYTVEDPFREKYAAIPWRDAEKDYQAWCEGKTGYELVDAGMRQLVATGYMHNRVRMLVASFLTKHLLIDWKLGERFFARYLMDYEMASNVGGWQWAAGCGTDAAPYFRIFSPDSQLEKFDKGRTYCHEWLPEMDGKNYPVDRIVDHKEARQRALDTYKKALDGS